MKEYESQEYHSNIAKNLKTIYYSSKYPFGEVDRRLEDYVEEVVNNPEDHNLYELLAVRKFIRLWDKYTFDTRWVQDVISLEDVLLFKTDEGPMKITLSPCQVFQFASIFGFRHTVIVEKQVPVKTDEGIKMETQFSEEVRRLVTHFVLMVPRKYGKTSEMVFFAIEDFLFGDDDAEIYCCSNSEKQAKILFDFIKFSLQRLDKQKKYFRTTLTEASWKSTASKKTGKTSLINSLSGGAETKDGLKCSLHIQDEYGAAKYVNGHSDAASLYQVVTSSMGTRKQPLSGIITTAGRVMDGPFQPMLQSAKAVLRGESEADWQFAHIFQPDGWEMGDEFMKDEHLWRKVQPHYGFTVQSTYYKSKYEEACRDKEAWIEFNTKLLNKFQSDNVEEWINSQKIINLQCDKYISDLQNDDDWECYIGCDFSQGDDLCEMTYLCYNTRTQEYFLDCDAWITEETYNNTAKNPLYRKWVDKGWLHVCKGRVIDENEMVERLDQIKEYVNIKRIGYDRYSSLRFVSAFRSWMDSLGMGAKDIDATIVPVSQLNATFNASCEEMLYIVNIEPSILSVSPNPIIPWCFGNCYLDVDGLGNKKPQKQLRNGKIDVVIGALEGLIMQQNS